MTQLCIYILMYLMEGIIAFYYLGHSFTGTRGKLSLFMAYVVTYSLLVWVFTFHEVFFNLFAFLVCHYLLIISFYKTTSISALMHSAILSVCMGLSEIIVANLFGGLLTEYSDVAALPLSMSIPFILVSKSLYFLFLYLIHFFVTQGMPKKSPIDKGEKMILYTAVLFFIVFSSLVYISFHNALTDFSQQIMIGLSTSLFLLNCLIIWIYDYHQKQTNKIVQLEFEKQRMVEARQYNSLMEHQAEQLKILRHDIKNHLSVIQAMYKSGAYEQANTYVNSLLRTDALTHFFQPTNCETLNLILARYCTMCQEKNISFHANAQNSNIHFLHSEDITSLFCNLLDNAFEAAMQCVNPYIDLTICNSKDNQKTIVTLINSCSVAPISDCDNTFLSSKKDAGNHGIGQKSIQRVVHAYQGKIDTYYSEAEKEFHTILFLCPISDTEGRNQ